MHIGHCHTHYKTENIVSYHFSGCTKAHQLYHEASVIVMGKAFQKTEEMLRKSHTKCRSNEAWNEKSENQFRQCTNQLRQSFPWVYKPLNNIEKFVAKHMNSTTPTEVKVWTALEDNNSSHDSTIRFNMALSFIESEASSSTLTCSEIPKCQEKARKISLQLLLIDWGIFGPGEIPAGMFLANHYPALGPYFGNTEGHKWPGDPLRNDPTPFEARLNEEMVKMTELISNRTIRNVTILDLPAFGSKIAWLLKQHRIESNWPTETNFAIKNGSDRNLNSLFMNYKILLDDWNNYLKMVYKNISQVKYTYEMKNNRNFNFTHYVKKNMKAFLLATHGSFLTASKETSPFYSQTAQTLFNQSNVDSSQKGYYDKLIMECAFREDLFTKRPFDLDGGCELFSPALTTNGFCYSFNAMPTADIWNSTDIMDEFRNSFPSHHSEEFFHDFGRKQGKIDFSKTTQEGISLFESLYVQAFWAPTSSYACPLGSREAPDSFIS